jgi:hypothetical protein
MALITTASADCRRLRGIKSGVNRSLRQTPLGPLQLTFSPSPAPCPPPVFNVLQNEPNCRRLGPRSEIETRVHLSQPIPSPKRDFLERCRWHLGRARASPIGEDAPRPFMRILMILLCADSVSGRDWKMDQSRSPHGSPTQKSRVPLSLWA